MQIHFDTTIRLGDIVLGTGLIISAGMWVTSVQRNLRRLAKSNRRMSLRVNLLFRWWLQTVIGDEAYMAEYKMIEQQELNDEEEGDFFSHPKDGANG